MAGISFLLVHSLPAASATHVQETDCVAGEKVGGFSVSFSKSPPRAGGAEMSTYTLTRDTQYNMRHPQEDVFDILCRGICVEDGKSNSIASPAVPCIVVCLFALLTQCNSLLLSE